MKTFEEFKDTLTEFAQAGNSITGTLALAILSLGASPAVHATPDDRAAELDELRAAIVAMGQRLDNMREQYEALNSNDVEMSRELALVRNSISIISGRVDAHSAALAPKVV